MQFEDLNLIRPLLRAVRAEGYDTPTPIQVQAIPHVLTGQDLIGCAQTGTGKTAAFALPILQRLAERSQNNQNNQSRAIRALILSPTRELAAQIADSFAAYGHNLPLRHAVIFGGVNQHHQVRTLQRGVDILVATPGRLLDLMGQGYVRLNRVEIFVLDETDRMLDMGFIRDVERVIQVLPTQRQTLLFSATMPAPIVELSRDILHDPLYVEVTPQATTVEKIAQSVYMVERKDKRALLEHLLADSSIRRALIFTRTKHGADKLVEQLERAGVMANAIHSNKSQAARERALANLKNGKIRVLVATDIAARGLDVEGVTHVINYDIPNEPESYVHRIGRTARAGASGIAYSFCDVEERKYLRDIEKLIRLTVPVVGDHPYVSTAQPVEPSRQGNRHRNNHSRNGNGNNNSNNNGNGNRSGGQRGGPGRNSRNGQRNRPAHNQRDGDGGRSEGASRIAHTANPDNSHRS